MFRLNIGKGFIIAGVLALCFAAAVAITGVTDEPVAQSEVGAAKPAETPQSAVLGEESIRYSGAALRSDQSRVVVQASSSRMAEVARTGAGWFMLPDDEILVWGNIALSQGQYDWSRLDQVVLDAQKNGFHLLLPVAPFAAWDAQSCHGDAVQTVESVSQFNIPCDPDAFFSFVNEMAERYASSDVQQPSQEFHIVLVDAFTQSNVSYTYSGEAGEWDFLRIGASQATDTYEHFTLLTESWPLLQGQSQEGADPVKSEQQLFIALIQSYLNGAEKTIVPVQQNIQGEVNASSISAIQTFVRAADQFLSVYQLGATGIAFHLPENLDRWVFWSDRPGEERLNDTLSGQVKVKEVGGREYIAQSDQVRISPTPIIVAYVGDPSSDTSAGVETKRIQHLSLARLEGDKPSPASATFNKNDTIVLIVRLAGATDVRQEAELTLLHGDGSVVVPSSRVQLMNGEIGLPNPGISGKYRLILRISDQEKYEISFSVEEYDGTSP